MKRIIQLLLMLAVWAACNNTPSKPAVDYGVLKSHRNDSLYLLVGKKHDDIMPKDADIERFIFKIRAQQAKQPQETLLDILSELNAAHEAMMEWMHNIKNTDLHADEYAKMSESQIWEYLLKEEKGIERVTEMMLQSLQKADSTRI